MIEKTDLATVGNRINNIRINKGLTMEEFGEYFKTSKGTVNNWEKGRNLPNKENLKIIADLGGITVDELLYGDRETFALNYIKEKLVSDMTFFEENSMENEYQLVFNRGQEIINKIIGFLSPLEDFTYQNIKKSIDILVPELIFETYKDTTDLILDSIKTNRRLKNRILGSINKKEVSYMLPSDTINENVAQEIVSKLDKLILELENLKE